MSARTATVRDCACDLSNGWASYSGWHHSDVGRAVERCPEQMARRYAGLSRDQLLAKFRVPSDLRKLFVEPGTPGCYQSEWPRSGKNGPRLNELRIQSKVAVLGGSVGAGKTSFAVEMLHRFGLRGYPGYYTDAAAMAKLLVGVFDEDDSPARFDRVVDRVSVLVVDDFGYGHTGERETERMVAALMQRLAHDRKLTIFGTNLQYAPKRDENGHLLDSGSTLTSISAPLADRMRKGLLFGVTGKSVRVTGGWHAS